MSDRKKSVSILIVVLVVLVLPLLLLASRQRQEIRKKAAANDVTVYLNQTTLDPGGSTTGAINVSAGGTRIQAVRTSFTFDSTKLTISNLRCGTDLPSKVGAASIGSGTATITCTASGTGTGITNKIFAAALFNVQVASSASRGSVIPINLTSNTNLVDPNGNFLNGALNNANITVTGGAEPIAGDTNGNGCVGARDLGFVLGHFQTSSQCTPTSPHPTPGPAANGDFNQDGCVDDLDLSVVSSKFRYDCNE